MENVIRLKEDNILRFELEEIERYEIKKTIDKDGKEIEEKVPVYRKTGEYLEFDIEDIEFPLRVQECEKQHHKNIMFIKSKYLTIEKQQDKKGKYLISKNTEEKMKALKEFYDREAQAIDYLLGENGTKKMLNGRKPYYSMYDDIIESLEPILPKLKQNADSIISKIKSKYETKDMDVME